MEERMSTDLPFDLTLTDEQAMTRDSVQRFVARHVGPVARSADDQGAAPTDFFALSAELGLALMPVPEALGGAGQLRDPMSGVLTAEDLGQGDISLAIGAMSPVSVVNSLLDFGSDEQQALFLPRLATGEFVAAGVALMEGQALFDPAQLSCKAVPTDNGYRLSGEKRLVPFGVSAELLLVIADLEGEGAQAFVVERGAAGMSAERQSYMGLRALELATVRFDNVEIAAINKLANFDLERLLDLSRLGMAALAVGCCQAVLDYSIPFVKERQAFGEPIARRQSVAFMVANIGIELEGMRLLVWKAASLASQGKPFHREAYLARVLCAEKAMEIGTNGVQLFGGAGFIRDYPLEMWYRNLRAIGVLEGAVIV
jgi:alkylation response protein AidB-like acyl-CoA dehydrogenase